jgi:phosphoribosylglycinamide formyltransferase 1
MKKKLLIMISGRGSNMEAILKNCLSGSLSQLAYVSAVFSNNLHAPGLSIARSLGYSIQAIDSRSHKRSEFNNLLKEWLVKEKPDFIILAGYMLILPPDIIELFPERIINIHPADTRLHQGLHGYEWAWGKKLSQTCITVHYVDQGLDTGKIIAQQQVSLSGCQSKQDLELRGLKIEHELYSAAIAALCRR